MANLSTVTCDVCGKIRTPQEKGWFLGMYPAVANPNTYLLVSPLCNEFFSMVATVHLCGEKCTNLWFSRQLSAYSGVDKKSFEEPQKSA